MSVNPEMLRSRMAKHHDEQEMTDEEMQQYDEENLKKSLLGEGGSSNSGSTNQSLEIECNKKTVVAWARRNFWYRLSILPACVRWTLWVLMSLVVFHTVLNTIDVLFRTRGFDGMSKSRAESFAVVINTYKRPEMLQDAVEHYAGKCGPEVGVSQVYIVWAELNNNPPKNDSFLERYPKTKNHSTVEVLRMTKDSLNGRFLPIPSLASDVLFMVDDDVRVDCKSLRHGLDAWNFFPDSLVGYYPRLGTRTQGKKESDSSSFVYHNWVPVFLRSKFNFILTKASFMHKKYLDLYSDPQKHPPEILEFVDKHMNCEDVAMAMLVANYTSFSDGKPARPIYVEGHVQDKGLFGGISTGGGHFGFRSVCLAELTKIYIQHGWPRPLDYTVSMKDSTDVHHAPGFWFQHQPGNFFEWLAINVMTTFQ